MNKRKLLLAVLTIIAIVGFSYLKKSNSDERPSSYIYIHNEGTTFGTIYHVKYLYNKDLKTEIEAELHRVDASLSMFNPQSTISLINKGESNTADSMLAEVLQLSFAVNRATDGAFDPTVAPLVNAWGFGFKKGQLPNSTQVDSLLNLVGLSSIHFQDGKVAKDNPLSILDMSAIAKGYGDDPIAQLLRGYSIKNFMVEIGGEVIAEGINEKGASWRIGINKPNEDSTSLNTELQDIVSLSGHAIATSGNYRNFYVKDGKKIAHTINPKTGYPAQQDILSSTVVAPTCAEADAFATAFMVMGMEKAKQVLQEQSQLDAYFIYSNEKGNYQTWASKGFDRLIVR